MFIIAEIGSNFLNDAQAEVAIEISAASGASAVKFQYQPEVDCYRSPRSVSHGSLTPDLLPRLRRVADASGIEFMCTPFSEVAVKLLNPHVSRWKIASGDNNFYHLLEAVRWTGKPVILSTGGTELKDLDETIKFLRPRPVTLLYCVSAYPSTWHNLFAIDMLRERYPGIEVGYSDHSTDVYSAISAVKHFNCPVIEKHFNPLNLVTTPDRGHSVSRDQFAYMVDFIRGKSPVVFPTPEEDAMFSRHNRRLVATRDIRVGDLFKYGVTHRAYRGETSDLDRTISPMAWQSIEGTIAMTHIPAGTNLHK